MSVLGLSHFVFNVKYRFSIELLKSVVRVELINNYSSSKYLKYIVGKCSFSKAVHECDNV